jgi:ATP-dependent protease ClpP protease subunit
MSNVKEDWQPHINVIKNDIWFTGDITLIGINDLIKEVQQCLNNKHVDSKINLFISSPGGSISPAMVFHNYLNLNYKHINVIGTGRICSSATYFLFTKCDTFVYPNIYALFHPMNFECNDNQQAVEAKNKLYKHLTKSVNDVYLSKGFKCNWAKEDVYLFADDLISKGIVDGIWQDD